MNFPQTDPITGFLMCERCWNGMHGIRKGCELGRCQCPCTKSPTPTPTPTPTPKTITIAEVYGEIEVK